jgi:hypothetical protein
MRVCSLIRRASTAPSEQRERAGLPKGAVKNREPGLPAASGNHVRGYRQTRPELRSPRHVRDRQGAQELKPGDQGEIIPRSHAFTPTGGQVGDRGWFYPDDHNTIVAEGRPVTPDSGRSGTAVKLSSDPESGKAR